MLTRNLSLKKNYEELPGLLSENDGKVQYMAENENKTENDDQVQEMLTKTKGPSLSHHAAALVQDDLLLLVGGWDGKTRSSKVWLFSLEY